MEGITGHQGHRTTDDYGNPVNHQGDYSSTGTGTGVTTGAHGTTPLSGDYGHEGQQHHDGGGVTGKLHRSGSSSSSSSEDDGMGGRSKKKGIKDRIREKLPGGNKDEQLTSTTTHGTYGYEGEHGQGQEKKGVMDKIKDMLPGGNRD